MKRSNQDGFTLVELLIALVFFTFILVFATASYVQINRSYVRGANVKLVQEQTRKVINDISSEIRLAGRGPQVIDIDDSISCSPIETKIDRDGTGNKSVPSNCIHRICIGDKLRYAWNQAVITSDNDETTDYYFQAGAPDKFNFLGEYHPTQGREPFSLVKETNSTNSAGCDGRFKFHESTDMVDSERVMVQDIDVFPLNSDNTSYFVRVSLSTLDSDPKDNFDLNYQSVDGDGSAELPDSRAKEFKALNCQADPKSLEFCHVETLTTIVTLR